MRLLCTGGRIHTPPPTGFSLRPLPTAVASSVGLSQGLFVRGWEPLGFPAPPHPRPRRRKDLIHAGKSWEASLSACGFPGEEEQVQRCRRGGRAGVGDTPGRGLRRAPVRLFPVSSRAPSRARVQPQAFARGGPAHPQHTFPGARSLRTTSPRIPVTGKQEKQNPHCSHTPAPSLQRASTAPLFLARFFSAPIGSAAEPLRFLTNLRF